MRNLFARKAKLTRLVPDDPNQYIVDEIYSSFPYGAAPFGLRSMIQMVIHTALEMKKRGLI